MTAAPALTGRRILVPRTQPEDAILAAVQAAGADAVGTELVRTTAVDPPTGLDAALARLGTEYAWLAVTSAATVEVLLARAAALGSTLPALVGSARVAAVGPGTARALESAGVTVDLVPSGESGARTLVAVWPAAPDPGTADPRAAAVLLPRSEIAAPTLAAGLREAGWRVADVVAYRTRTAPRPDPAVAADLAAGRIDAVLLTSGSTARALVTLYGARVAARICAIGAATAQAASEVGLRVHAIADEQTPHGLVAAAVRALTAADAPASPPADADDASTTTGPTRPRSEPTP